ncbi:MAG: hypothetical protein J7604_22440 [Sporocytophaga sp.]|uniref:hypothetical protein n=1 Tax=Sporocytophaga sp. TaxID=2231183 RepID=UPI001B1CD01D|nr:hypothetical protein [Sporocytophaga sp.]MBO9702991.1 hypothetical protein [Sporocytophaga sp.]
MKKTIIGIILLLAGIILSINTYGQSDLDPNVGIMDPIMVTNPNFLVTIIAGVLMALGFQFILTNLSVALGITSIGNIKQRTERFLRNTYLNSKEEVGEEEPEDKKETKNVASKFMSLAGGWTLVTGTISLFLACMLAVKLSLIESNAVGFTLGLVIWAVFSMVMIYLETRALGSIISGVWGAAISAIRSGISGAGSIFSSRESQADRDKNVVDKIRDEVYQLVEDPEMNTKFDNVIEKIRPKFDTHQFKTELAELLNEIKIEQKGSVSPDIRELFIKVAEKEPAFSRTDVSSLDKIFESALAGVGLSGVSRQAGGLGSKASEYVKGEVLPKVKEEYIPKFKEEYLPKIKDEMEHYVMDRNPIDTDPEIVRAEIDEIFSHEVDISKIKSQGKIFDKDDIATAVADQKGVSRSEALNVADKLEDALNSILRSSNIKEIVSPKLEETKEKFEETKEKVKETLGEKKEEYMNRLEGRFQQLFRRIDRPELDYNLLKKEFIFMIQNPRLAPKVLKMKLKQMDSNTLVGLLTASGTLNKSEINNVVRKFEDVKSDSFQKMDQAEDLIRRKTREASEFALEQAENTRKLAAEAGWWLFAMLVISGIAAGLGGALGM